MEIGKIKRVVSGVASDTEKQDVADWVAGNEQRRRFLEDARHFYDSEMPDEREIARRVEKMWRNTFGRRRRNRMLYLRWIAPLAAAAAVAGIFFFTDLQRKDTVLPAPLAEQPLATTVQLVLSDGSRHELADKGTVQEIVEAVETSAVPAVEYNEIIVPKGKGYTLTLADGSAVILNAESRIKFPTAFTGAERKVFLSGEAYFNVARNEEHPFVVEFAEGSVRVLGTEFNVKAYGERPACATLVKGKVEVMADEETVLLRPGELCEILPGGLSVSEADLVSVLAWKNGEFVFKEASWQQVMDELARWYGTEIVYDTTDMKGMKFHIYMERPATLAEALKIIARIAPVSYSVKDGKMIIKKQ